MNCRNISIRLSAYVLLGITGILVYFLSVEGCNVGILLGTLILLPFCGFPPTVSILLSARSTNSISQIILAAASLLYGVWFVCVTVYLFYGYPACLINVLPLFPKITHAGFRAFPVLLPLWIAVLIIELRYRKKRQPTPSEP